MGFPELLLVISLLFSSISTCTDFDSFTEILNQNNLIYTSNNTVLRFINDKDSEEVKEKIQNRVMQGLAFDELLLENEIVKKIDVKVLQGSLTNNSVQFSWNAFYENEQLLMFRVHANTDEKFSFDPLSLGYELVEYCEKTEGEISNRINKTFEDEKNIIQIIEKFNQKNPLNYYYSLDFRNKELKDLSEIMIMN